MSLTVWQDQDVDQFREVASRLASVIQSSVDRSGALSQLTESVESGDAFTDLLIEFAGRWFHETGGQSVLIGPELFWLLSEPNLRKGISSALRGPETAPDLEYSVSRRSRKLLLICVFETLAQNQWLAGNIGEHVGMNGVNGMNGSVNGIA
ncbi:hypothetical protein ACFYO1_43575 [Nocardia sp. NPDC006044]|uniref:hypothetical protein n=1 Tax=Nocardia TaxID=1817 RepID=UPI0035DA9442